MLARTLLPALAAAALLPVASLPAPAAAQEPQASTRQVSHVDDALAQVPVVGARAREAQAAHDATAARLAAATAAHTAAEAELADLAARDAALTTRIAERTDDRKAAALRLVEARWQVQQAAAGAYVASASNDPTVALLDPADSDRAGAVRALSEIVREDRERAADAARRAMEAASADVQAAHDERVQVRRRHQEVTEARDRAAAEIAAATAELEVRTAELADARAVSRVQGADFALVALDAYRRAAAAQPACGITWWALAGIGRVESRHGTYGGSALAADGRVTRPIVGIALDGTNDTRPVPDSDGGALDGDATVDRAVGPMQFIPTTWATWGRDGDGDGERDPQNLYDAAAAAAAYLCHGRHLGDDASLRAAYLSYNHSEAYAAGVLADAHRYARLRFPPP